MHIILMEKRVLHIILTGKKSFVEFVALPFSQMCTEQWNNGARVSECTRCGCWACRDDVAQLLVAVQEEPCAVDMTFEVRSTVPVTEPWAPPSGTTPASRNWGELLQSAGLKRGVTGRTVDGVYTGKDPESGYRDSPAAAAKEVQGAAA